MREIQEEKFLAKKIENPDFAETVELCFVNGPPKLRNWSKLAKFYVNFIISFTQLGICCILLVFITRSIEQVIHNLYLFWSNKSNKFHYFNFFFFDSYGKFTATMNGIFL